MSHVDKTYVYYSLRMFSLVNKHFSKYAKYEAAELVLENMEFIDMTVVTCKHPQTS